MSNNSELDPWFNMIPQSTLQKLVDPAVENIGRGLGGIASIIANPFVKLGIVSDANIKNFELKIHEKNNKIPSENRDDSKQGLALKALEDSIYQLDSEILQEYFTNLISSTLDNRKNEVVKPSFSSILKDFSPKDAILFNKIFKERTLALISIRVENKKTGAGGTVLENVILLNNKNIHEPSTLDALQRFGLIRIEKERDLLARKFVGQYERFKQSDTFLKYENELPHINENITMDSLRLIKGSVSLSEFGKEFGSVIISD